MRQLISMGATKNFSEDVQWAIRMLLPWQEDKPAGDASSRNAVLAGALPDQKCRPYLLNQKQLAALMQPVEEVSCFCGVCLWRAACYQGSISTCLRLPSGQVGQWQSHLNRTCLSKLRC